MLREEVFVAFSVAAALFSLIALSSSFFVWRKMLAANKAAVSSKGAPHPFKGGLLFESKIAISENSDSFIYPASILTRREMVGGVISTLSSVCGTASYTGCVLPVSNKLGAQAVLNLRLLNTPDDRRFMVLDIKTVPMQNGRPINVLMIGDSITNRQGAALLDRYLRELGFNPTMIGLLEGADISSHTGGLYSEGRSGWESGDFTYAINDRALPIDAGEEAKFLELGKGARVSYNPFIRLCNAEDPPELVRNGYIFDCAYYQSRFGLQAPDVVINALGTNDARDRTAVTIYDHIYDNDRIIHSQIRSAWPKAKIIRTLPATASSSSRDARWTSRYAKMIRAIRSSAKDLADPYLIVAPLWAMTNSEGGYEVPVKSPGSDGFVAGTWSDPIHPNGSSQHGYYRAMAPFVGAAAMGII